MPINDEDVRRLQHAMSVGNPPVEMGFEDAKQRLHEVLYLYWILAHKPPSEGGPPDLPPPPPWF